MRACSKLALMVVVVSLAWIGSASTGETRQDLGNSRSIMVSSPIDSVLTKDRAPDLVAEFARVHGLAYDESRRVFEDSGPIADFLEANRSDLRFGSFWVTYDAGYQIHVRYLEDSFQPRLRELEDRVGRSITVHRGGASAADLATSEATLKNAQVPYEQDPPKGTLRLFEDSLSGAVGLTTAEIRVLPGVAVELGAAPTYDTREDSRAGADVWYNNGSSWATVCTSAAMWSGMGMSGYISAAHCPNLVPSYTFVDGGYSDGTFPVQHTICGQGGDYEYVRFSTTKNEAETFLDKRYDPPVETTFRVAGGYYQGQPSFKVGMTSNGSTGTNMGSIAGYATSEVGEQCEWIRPHLRYWHSHTGGDSGGPVFLFYNGEWYLGAIHNGFDAALGGWVYGTAIWDTFGPPDTHICSLDNPCN